MISGDSYHIKRTICEDQTSSMRSKIDEYYARYRGQSGDWHDKFVKPLQEQIDKLESDYDNFLGGTIKTFYIGDTIVEGHLTKTGKVYLLYSGADSGGYDAAENMTVYDTIEEFIKDSDLAGLFEILFDNNYLLWNYGQPIVGVWRCKNNHEYFPNQLKELKLKPPFFCPDCGELLTYDEEA